MTSRSPIGYIGRGLSLNGRLGGEGEVRIDGMLEGEVDMRGRLEVGEDATVRGPVAVSTAVVSGRIHGSVRADRSVTIREGGRIDGDVHASSVAIDDGGVLAGGVHMDFELPDDVSGPQGEGS